MKMMLLAAAAALTLGSATAFAADGGDLPATTTFTLIQQSQQPAAQRVERPSIGNSAAYPVQSHDQGTWLFAPYTGGGS